MLSRRLVEQVHELHGFGFEQVHDRVDARHQVVVCEKSDHTHHETGHCGYQRGVDTGRECGYIGRIDLRRNGVEGINNTY